LNQHTSVQKSFLNFLLNNFNITHGRGNDGNDGTNYIKGA